MIDIIGKKFTRLTVVAEIEPYVSKSGKSRARRFICRCDCGNETKVTYQSLISNNTRSCGCLQSELTIKRNKRISKYGDYSKNKHFNRWRGMIERCYYPKHKDYHRYGGRGITVCEEWRGHPKNFINWVENESNWEDGKNLSLDRIDYNKGYSPENCRFVTPSEQALNKDLLSSNKSGYPGVSLHTNGRWRARITVNGKRISLGVYKDVNEAIRARKKAEEKYLSK